MSYTVYNYKGEISSYQELTSGSIVGVANDAYLVNKDNETVINTLYVFDAETNSWIRETIYSRRIVDIDEGSTVDVFYNYKGAVNFMNELDSISPKQRYDAYMVRYALNNINNSITVINQVFYYNDETGVGNWDRVPTSQSFQKHVEYKKKINGFVYTLNPKTDTDSVYTNELVLGTNKFKTLTEKLEEIIKNNGLKNDPTLTINGDAADAKVTGDWLRELDTKINNSGGFSEFFTDYLNLFNPNARQAGLRFDSSGNITSSGNSQAFYVDIENKKTNNEKITYLTILVPNLTPEYRNKVKTIFGIDEESNIRSYVATPVDKTLDRTYAHYNINISSNEPTNIIINFDFSVDDATTFQNYINHIIICDTTVLNAYNNYYKIKTFDTGKVMLDPLKVDSDIHSNIIFNTDNINISNVTDVRKISIDTTGNINIINKNNAVYSASNSILIGKESENISSNLNYGIEFAKNNTVGTFSLWVNDNKFVSLTTDPNTNSFIHTNDTLIISTINGSSLSFNNTNPGLFYKLGAFKEEFKSLNTDITEAYNLSAGDNITIKSVSGVITIGNDNIDVIINDNGLSSNIINAVNDLYLRGSDIYTIFALAGDLASYLPLTGGILTGELIVNANTNTQTLTTGDATVNGSLVFTSHIMSYNNDNKVDIDKTSIKLQSIANNVENGITNITPNTITLGNNQYGDKLIIDRSSIINTSTGDNEFSIDANKLYIKNNIGSMNLGFNNNSFIGSIVNTNGISELSLTSSGNNTVNIISTGGTATLNVANITTNSISPVTGNNTVNILGITTSIIKAATTSNPTTSGIIQLDSSKITALEVTGETNLKGNTTLSGSIVTVGSNTKVKFEGTNIEISGNTNDGLVLSDIVNNQRVTISYKDGKLSSTNWEIDNDGNATFATITTYGGDSTLN